MTAAAACYFLFIFLVYLTRGGSIPEELWKDSQKYHLGFLTYRDDILNAGTKPDRYMVLESQISAMPIEYCRNFGETMDDSVNGCLFTGKPAHILEVEPILKEKYVAMNEVYGSYFAEPYPARAAFEVAKLPKGAKVEIEVIAVR